VPVTIFSILLNILASFYGQIEPLFLVLILPLKVINLSHTSNS